MKNVSFGISHAFSYPYQKKVDSGNQKGNIIMTHTHIYITSINN